MNDPERLNLPSASAFGITALCPGQPTLVASLHDIPEPVDEDAERGSRLHLAWQTEDPSQLDMEDREIYGQGLKLVERVKGDWKNLILSVPAIQEGNREERFWLRGPNGEPIASGQADRHYIFLDTLCPQANIGLVIDFKSLWCRSLVPAELNWQARLLAVLVAKEYGLTHIRFAFLKAMFSKVDIVDYNEQDLKRAEWSVNQVLWESRQPNAQRRPGAHCRHCKAATACPECKAYCLLPSVKTNALEGVTPKQAGPLVEALDLQDCVRIFETQTSRRNIEDAIKARLKALPLGTLAELGLTFGKPKVTRTITDIPAVVRFLLSVGVPEAQLWAAMKISNGQLSDVVQNALSLPSEKAATAWIRDKLKPFIVEEEQDKPLEKI
jgi:hypothetical protein